MKTKNMLATSVLGVFMLVLMLYPQRVLHGAQNGISIVFNTLLPSLFPFMLLSMFLVNTNLSEKLFYYPSLLLSHITRLDKSIFPLLFIGNLGGYPCCASNLRAYYKNGQIGKKDAEIISCVFTGGGPAFLISTVGCGLFLSTSLGFILYISSLLSSLTLVLFNYNTFSKIKIKKNAGNIGYSKSFIDAVNSSCKALSIIFACVVVFSIMIEFLPNFLHNYIGLFEISLGVVKLSNEFNLQSIIAVAFITGFGGLCIIFQIKSILSEVGISLFKLIKTRSIYAVVNSIYTLILINVIPITVNETFTNNTENVFGKSSLSQISLLLFLALCVAFPLSMPKNKA